MKLLFLSLASLIVVILSLGDNVVTAKRRKGKHVQGAKLKDECYSSCFEPDCPCPGAIQQSCLNSCGLDACPCASNDDSTDAPSDDGISQSKENAEMPVDALMREKRSLNVSRGRVIVEGGERSLHSYKKVYSVVTVNMKRIGPLCSGFLVLANTVVSTKSCVSSAKPQDLFVTVNLHQKKPSSVRLNVVRITPFVAKEYPAPFDVPVLIHLENHDYDVFTLDIAYYDFTPPCRLEKWEISKNYKEYWPIKVNIKKPPVFCKNDQYICANASSSVRYGWNDVGTPIVDSNGNAFGIDIGLNLYQKTKSFTFLAFKAFQPWMEEVLSVSGEE